MERKEDPIIEVMLLTRPVLVYGRHHFQIPTSCKPFSHNETGIQLQEQKPKAATLTSYLEFKLRTQIHTSKSPNQSSFIRRNRDPESYFLEAKNQPEEKAEDPNSNFSIQVFKNLETSEQCSFPLLTASKKLQEPTKSLPKLTSNVTYRYKYNKLNS